MSAMPDNVLPFELPKKPRIKLGETLPDQRKIAVVPIRCITDKQMTHGMIKTLMLLCSYANRAGITWVGQKRLSQDAGISQQAISKQIVKLTKLGYLQIIRKSKPGEWMTTWRIVYDTELTVEDVIANTSNKEDNRSPGMIKEEEKRLQQDVDKEGLNRINTMIQQSIINQQKLNKKEYQMPQDRETITVKKMKSEIAKKKKIHPQPTPVDNPVDNLSHLQPLEVVTPCTTSKGCTNLSFNNNIYNLVMDNQRFKSVSKSAIDSAIELLIPAYQAEGITPTERSLADGVMHMLDLEHKTNPL